MSTAEQSLYEKRRLPQHVFDRARTSLNKYSADSPPTSLKLNDLEINLSKAWSSFENIHETILGFLNANEKDVGTLETKTEQAEAKYEEVYEKYCSLREKIEALRFLVPGFTPVEVKKTKMESFSLQLELLRNRFRQILDYVDAEDEETTRSQVEIGINLTNIDNMMKDVDNLESEAVIQLSPHESSILQKNSRLLYKDLVKVNVRLTDMKVDFNTTNCSGSSQGCNSGVKIKLPMLDLPSFSGDILEWKSFSDLFTAAIRCRNDLSGAQKLQFLQRAVDKGDAKKVISHLSIQDSNYSIAWELLVARYEDSREAINNLMKKLLDQPKMTSDSYEGLRKLLDTTNSCLRGLKSYEMNVKGWGEILVYLLTSKLDRETRKQWLLSNPGTEWPKFDDLMSHLESRAKTLSQLDGSTKKPDDKAKRDDKRKSTVGVHHVEKGTCPLCSESHPLTQCEKWKKATVEERNSVIRRKHLCWRCLSTDHITKDCKSKNCNKCQGNHSRWICFQDQRNVKSSSSSPSTSRDPGPKTKSTESKGDTDAQTLYHCSGGERTVLMETCVVRIRGADSSYYLGRVFLDGGAEADFILRESADKLNLPRSRTQTTIVGIGDHPVGVSSQIMKLTLRSKYDDSAVAVNALIVDKLTNNLPRKEVDPSQWPELASLPLADPNFHKPNKINIILGAGTYAKIKRAGLVQLGKDGPTAQETIFGYVLQGNVENCSPPLDDDDDGDTVKSNHVMLAYSNLKELEVDVKRLYELDDGPNSSSRSAEHEQCEQHFADNYYRDENGRYVVKLPFREMEAELGNSRESARIQFLRLEKKLSKDPESLQKYNDVFKEYLECGYMEPVPDEEIETVDKSCFYLPHHAVKKETSSTTKIRPVFNASAKSSSGYSLNDLLMDGPNIQDDIVPLMIRFGKHAVPLKADARQWYLQFRVHPDHVNFQRIFWRSDPTQPLRIWRFLVVVFGEGPAAFLAQRCQQQLCLDEKESFPAAAQVLMEDCYRDDLVSGAANTTAAIALHKEIVDLLARGGLVMRKWASSDETFLKSLPPENCEISPFEFDDDVTIKTLGIIWHARGDYYSFKVRAIPDDMVWTKRSLLSDNARIYDPLGWLSPVTINARISMQKSWIVKNLDWDAALPEEILTPFLKYRVKLPEIEKLQLSRRIFDDDTQSVQLCGFSDASSDAYAAVIYVRSETSAGVKIKLVYAKAKVAPLSAQTINRLELEGALLLAQNLKSVSEALKLDGVPIYAWTDSSVVLSWIEKEPSSLHVFERNRVAKIQRLLPRSNWRHVKGIDNPADCASRGIKAEDLLDHPLWWNGPSWLATDNYLDSEDNSEVNLNGCWIFSSTFQHQLPWKIIDNVSTLLRLQCATACLFRAVQKFKTLKKLPEDVTLPYSSLELNSALEFWAKIAQSEMFERELSDLSQGKVVGGKSVLKQFAPFLEDGIIKVGGRLQNSSLSRDARHPIVLPGRHKFTLMLVQHFHRVTLHGGRQLMESLLQRKFYIVKPGNIYKDVVKNCVVCDKLSNHPESQFMSPLPGSRVTQTLPFERSGVDYAGPFMIKTTLGRKVEHVKAYVVVFVCFSTKAVHLELVTNASTDNFIGALKRFVSTRGYPTALHSDQGTNFEGANNKLSSWLKFLKKEGCDQAFKDELELNGIKWNFNPPGAPHFGGLWEAAVNSMKHHLKRVTLGRVLSYETLCTLLKQIEACLNSRPLTSISDDPNDFAALTPGHFLIGRPLLAIPEPDLAHLKENQLDQWQMAQRMFQEFWTRWTLEYLPRLQHRGKWHSIREEAEIGDLVRVVDENQPPMKWKLGRIVHLHPSKDKLNRVATIKIPYSNLSDLRRSKDLISADDIIVKTTELVRPLVKLCLLPKIGTK